MARVRVSLKLCGNVLNFFVTGVKVSNPVADQLVMPSDSKRFPVFSPSLPEHVPDQKAAA
jgi:hypothetical protein